jgi:hypothetical protein
MDRPDVARQFHAVPRPLFRHSNGYFTSINE